MQQLELETRLQGSDLKGKPLPVNGFSERNQYSNTVFKIYSTASLETRREYLKWLHDVMVLKFDHLFRLPILSSLQLAQTTDTCRIQE